MLSVLCCFVLSLLAYSIIVANQLVEIDLGISTNKQTLIHFKLKSHHKNTQILLDVQACYDRWCKYPLIDARVVLWGHKYGLKIVLQRARFR